ncbi:MAG: NUDIX hydrolase [Planctomycetes bacterium]|nr:NUDIX hydrolase [Planctomycetota bacterium]
MADPLLSKWRVEASENLHDCRIFTLRRDWVRFERAGARRDFYVLQARPWVNVVPVKPDGSVILVRQYRHGTREVTIEFPAGIVDARDADPRAAAVRELLEETGYAAAEMTPLGKVRPNPAFIDTWCFTFLATGLVHQAQPHFDAYEEVEMLEATPAALNAWIREGAINHSLTLNAWRFYEMRSQNAGAPPRALAP